MLNSIKEMLLPNGILVIDFLNAHKVINTLVKKETKIIVMDDAWLTRDRKKANIDSQKKLYFLRPT